MDIKLLFMLIAWCSCVLCMLLSLGVYCFELYLFKMALKKTPDCCMCGAIGPSYCDDHSYTPQRDWFISNFRPEIR